MLLSCYLGLCELLLFPFRGGAGLISVEWMALHLGASMLIFVYLPVEKLVISS